MHISEHGSIPAKPTSWSYLTNPTYTNTNQLHQLIVYLNVFNSCMNFSEGLSIDHEIWRTITKISKITNWTSTTDPYKSTLDLTNRKSATTNHQENDEVYWKVVDSGIRECLSLTTIVRVWKSVQKFKFCCLSRFLVLETKIQKSQARIHSQGCKVSNAVLVIAYRWARMLKLLFPWVCELWRKPVMLTIG